MFKVSRFQSFKEEESEGQSIIETLTLCNLETCLYKTKPAHRPAARVRISGVLELRAKS